MRKDILGAHAGGGSPVGVLALVQMLVALAVVFVLLRYLLPKVVAKAGKRLVAKVGSPIKIEESAAFGGGMLYVVEVRERTLLLSVGTQGVSCLADLTSTQPPQEPIQTFHEMLEETPTAADPVTAFTAVTPVPEEPEPQPPASTMTDQEARLALERLRKIVD
jgi:flagellar biogenesis protein FliO